MRHAANALQVCCVAFIAALALLQTPTPARAQLDQGPQVKLVTPRIDQPLEDPIVIQALVRAVPG
ncbi:MAG: hypothetical protein PVJ51_09055, partial [Acidobacteriota bacterium]